METILRALALLMVAALLGAIPAFFNPAARELLKDEVVRDEIPSAAASWLGAKALWIDARGRNAFDAGHVEGALLLNEEEWSSLLPAVIEHWKPGMPVIVYCDSDGCQASHKVANRLRDESGFENVKVLRGDWKTVRIRK